MSISVVVPVWNGRDLLCRLLDTIDAQTLPPAEILVVDNGSTDGAPELAASRGARVIAMGRNAGFAAAVNRGITESRSHWIAALNSDVELASDYFERLTATDGWFATGKLLDARRNGQLDGSFDLICRGATAWRAGSGREDGPVWNEPRRIFSPPWTAALFRAELFRKVGMLETHFESYLEDVEFGVRCAARGIAGVYVPEAVAWHRGSATLGRWHPATVRNLARNQLLLAGLHFPSRWWWRVWVAQSLWGLVAVRHGAGLAWLRGAAEGLRGYAWVRSRRSQSPSHLSQQVLRAEIELKELQSKTGMDLYWRLYFLLTGSGAK